MQETQVRSLAREDPLEKGMVTHSSILAWEIPWMEELEGSGPRGCRHHGVTEHMHAGGEKGGLSVKTHNQRKLSVLCSEGAGPARLTVVPGGRGPQNPQV